MTDASMKRRCRMIRTRCAMHSAIGMLLVTMIGTAAYAGPIAPQVVESEGNCWAGAAGMVAHGSIDANATHAIKPLFGGVIWDFSGDIVETRSAAGANDKLLIEGKCWHAKAVPTHGAEGVGGKMSFKMDLEAGKGTLKRKKNWLTRVIDGKEHDWHHDTFILTGLVILNAARTDIDAYLLALSAMHVNDTLPERYQSSAGEGYLVPGPGMSEDMGGTAAWVVNENGIFNLTLAVLNLSLGDIEAAHVRLGTVRNPGNIVFDLDPAAFVSLDGAGVVRMITGGAFPPENVSDLLNNNTLVEIVTPTGTLSSQLMRDGPPVVFPAPWHWGLIILVVVLVGGAALWIWRRRTVGIAST